MKLITPPSLLLTTALLAIIAVAAANVARIEHSYALWAGASLSAIACAGTAYMQRWSQYLVHIVTTGFIAKWCWSVYDGWRAGYFQFQFGSNAEALRSLLPGFALVVLSAACSWMVYSHFTRAARQPSPSA